MLTGGALTLLGLNAAIGVSVLIHGSFGFGFAFVALPVLALLWPESIPVVPLLVSVPVAVTMTVREWGAVEWASVPPMAVGWAAGAVAGTVVVGVLTSAAIGMLAGAAILATVAMTLLKPHVVRRNRRTCLGAGLAAGTMGTSAGVGGPALALLYHEGEGAALRATLSVVFSVGFVVSLLALALAGQVAPEHLRAAGGLLPGLVAGMALSQVSYRWLEGPWLRRLLLSFAAVMGLATVLRAGVGA